MMDLNPGKTGGAKRLAGYVALAAPEITPCLDRIARSLVWDVNSDAYIQLDLKTGVQTIDGQARLTPFVLAVQRAIQDKGHRVKGFLGRDQTFNGFHRENWRQVSIDAQGKVKGIRYKAEKLERRLQDAAAAYPSLLSLYELRRKEGLVSSAAWYKLDPFVRKSPAPGEEICAR